MAEVRKLQILDGGFEFKINAGQREFDQVIDRIKARVPRELRAFDGERKTWFVSNRFEDMMCKLFSNFESERDAILAQGCLF